MEYQQERKESSELTEDVQSQLSFEIYGKIIHQDVGRGKQSKNLSYRNSIQDAKSSTQKYFKTCVYGNESQQKSIRDGNWCYNWCILFEVSSAYVAVAPLSPI